VLRNEQRLGSRVIRRAAEQLAGRFNPEQIALAVRSSVHASELSALRDSFCRLQHPGKNMRLPKMPTRDQFLAEARDMFKKTGSLDDIVDRAYELLHKSVGSLLVVPAQWATADPTSA
jgi:stearoyl-CoA desaturase (Delta-9 desaturase)